MREEVDIAIPSTLEGTTGQQECQPTTKLTGVFFPVEPSSTEPFSDWGVKAWNLKRNELTKHEEVCWLTRRELCEDQVAWPDMSKPAKAGDKVETKRQGTPSPL